MILILAQLQISAWRDDATENDDEREDGDLDGEDAHRFVLIFVELVLGRVGDVRLVGVVDVGLAMEHDFGPQNIAVVEGRGRGGDEEDRADDGVELVAGVEVHDGPLAEERDEQHGGAGELDAREETEDVGDDVGGEDRGVLILQVDGQDGGQVGMSVGDGAIDNGPDDGDEQEAAEPEGEGEPVDGLDEHEEDHGEGNIATKGRRGEWGKGRERMVDGGWCKDMMARAPLRERL